MNVSWGAKGQIDQDSQTAVLRLAKHIDDFIEHSLVSESEEPM
jgi:hypothetical protein